MSNAQKKTPFVIPCLLVCKGWAAPSFADSAGFQLPSGPVLPTVPSSIFRAELPMAAQSFIQTWGTTPECPFEMPQVGEVWDGAGEMLWRLPKKKGYCCSRDNCFWSNFLAHTASGQFWVWVVKAQPVYFQLFAGNSSAYDVLGRELVWLLDSKMIISGIVTLSFSCQHRFTYLQKEQWRIMISRNVCLPAEAAVKWLNSS